MKHLSFKALAVAATLLSAGAGNAATLNIDSGWDEFSFLDVGSAASKIYDFTVTTAATLKITDAFFSGDRFEVILNGVSQGLTSSPVQGTTSIGVNYTGASTNPDYSSWAQYLTAGVYSLKLIVAQRSGTANNWHIGAVRLDTAPVPLPAAGLMLFGALGSVAALRRRRRAA